MHDRKSPFLAKMKERKPLTRHGSLKDTRHIVLDIAGSNIAYKSGDSIGVVPFNDPGVVDHLLFLLGRGGEELVTDREGNTSSLREFFLLKTNLKGISKKLLKELARRLSGDPMHFLESLLKEERKEELKEWMHSHDLLDLFSTFNGQLFSPQEISELTMPLLPRFYSIASSPLVHPNEVHLTVSYLKYMLEGRERLGVCTHYLCSLAPIEDLVLPIYLHPSDDFHLPSDGDIPILMIGPGTGIAPFRAFIHERVASGARGNNWLFFGEWTREKEFYYGEEFLELERKGALRLDLAFSRDQAEKVYVQHLLEARGREVFALLEEGGIIYVCGDLHRMAKDVEHALLKIIERYGGKTEAEAHAYIKNLRHEKRYLRDVY